MGVDLIMCEDCKHDIAIISAVRGRCRKCAEKLIKLLEASNALYAASNRAVKYDKATLIEASYRISSEQFKKVPRTKTVGFIRGYQKAGTIAHDVLKKMIEEAK